MCNSLTFFTLLLVSSGLKQGREQEKEKKTKCFKIAGLKFNYYSRRKKFQDQLSVNIKYATMTASK